MTTESTQSTEGATTEVAKAPGVEEFKVLQEQVTQLTQTNQRLLNESKEHADKYKTYKQKATAIEENEKKAMMESENWKGLYEKQVEQFNEVSKKYETTRKITLETKLENEVSKLAPDARNLKVVMNTIPWDTVEVDEDTMSIAGLDDAVKKLRTDESYLFKPETAPKMTKEIPTYETTQGTTQQHKQQDFLNAIKFITKKE